MNSFVIELLEEKFQEFNQPNFIPNDPICIPHAFSLKQDIEIMGFWPPFLLGDNEKPSSINVMN
jgi:hypothetical protein